MEQWLSEAARGALDVAALVLAFLERAWLGVILAVFVVLSV